MSHKCVRCGNVYEDNDNSILRGCKCGSIFFLYLKTPQDVQEIKEIEQELQTKDTTFEQELIKQIEEKKEEVKPEPKKEKIRPRRPKFGIETVRIPKEGVYEINIDALMKKRPLIVLERSGIYLVHLPSVFEKVRS
jgi:predicted  nucleic acid-binding Zn-ribbon protein